MGLIEHRLSTAISRIRRPRAAGSERRVVIVGNGMVSQHLCEALTGTSEPGLHISVFGEERYPAYDRIHLSTIDEPASALLADQDWYAQRGIALRLDTRAVKIERDAHLVFLSAGEAVAYDVLVLATGSAARMPSIAGIDLPRVFAYRTIDDVLCIRAAMRDAKRAVVVGGGLLGLEAARLALDARCETTLLEASHMLMPKQLDFPSAQWLQERVERTGVRVELGVQLKAIEPHANALRLDLAGERSLDADVVVIAIGVVPRDELARAAELKVAARGGVLVDDEMRTSDPSIYAVGDCACHAGRSYGLVGPGFEMADVLAKRLRGVRARFAGGDRSCELKLMGVPVSAVGKYDSEGRAVIATPAEGRRTLLLQEQRLVGAIAVGEWDELGRVRALAERRERISARALARFERTGRLFPDDEPGIGSWPASAIVCNCRRVSKGELEAQLRICGPDVAALSRCTGAGNVCGSCTPLLVQLVGKTAAVPQRVPFTRTLYGVATCVAVVALVLLLAPSVPFSPSVQDPWHRFDLARTREAYRQLTGFTLAALAALSMVVSLRKRFGWFKRVAFGGFRALHGLLGGLSLVVLLAHTGLRLGAGLNLSLMLCFVGAALLGSAAAMASAAETSMRGRVARRARRARAPLTLVHILVLWPLPILLVIHVLAAYYF